MRTTDVPTRDPHPSAIFHLRVSRLLAALLCALTWPLLTPALFAADTARVTYLKGKARYSTDQKNWKPIEKGTPISAGTVIQTAGNGSQVILVLEEKPHHAFDPAQSQTGDPFSTWTETISRLNIYESSVLAIDRLDVEKTKHGTISHAHFKLRAGQIFLDSRKLASKIDYQVTATTNSFLLATNGVYLITSSGATDVLTGQANITLTDTAGTNTQRTVSTGFRYDPATDKISPIPNNTAAALSPRDGDGTEHFIPKPRPITKPNLRPGI